MALSVVVLLVGIGAMWVAVKINLSTSIEPETLEAMTTIDGGEKIPAD